MKELLPQGKVLFLIGGIIVVVILLLIFISLNKQNQNTSQQPSASPTGKIQAIIEPTEYNLLEPEKSQTFKIMVSPPLESGNVSIEVKRKKVQLEDNFSNIRFNQQIDSLGLITVNLVENISPLSEYQILLMNKKNGQLVKEFHFSSNQELPSKSTVNNQKLRGFLPYETDSFRLTYSVARDSYIFSFKVNPNSNEAVDSQFEKAKFEAIKFIQSKGVDIKSIFIEWRYS
jgi:hypothetical protein